MEENIQNPQNVDDGELWKLLPSDIFGCVDRQVSSPKHSDPGQYYDPNNYRRDQQLSYVATEYKPPQGFTEIIPTIQQNFLRALPKLKRVGPQEVQWVSVGSLPPWCSVTNNCGTATTEIRVYGTGGGLWINALRPVYPCQFLIPVGAQAVSFMEERACVSPSRQKWIVPNGIVVNRFLQFPVHGVGFVGGFGRDYPGTGVYFPRLPATISSTALNNTAHARKDKVWEAGMKLSSCRRLISPIRLT